MPKSITDLTEEELLKALESHSLNPKYDEYKTDNDLMEWLSVYGIQSGTEPVLAKRLYKLYKKWSMNPIIAQNFTNELTQLLPNEKIGDSYKFLINIPDHEIKALFPKAKFRKVDKTKSSAWWKHFNSFVNKYEIKKGSLAIKGIVLYNLYDKWCYNNHRQNLLSQYAFIKFCKLCFTTKQVNFEPWFYVSQDIKKHLTPELIELMKKK